MPGRWRQRLADRLPEPLLQRFQRLQHGDHLSPSRAVSRSSARGTVPEVVTVFDVHAVRAEVAARVARALDHAAVPYVLVPGRRGAVRQVAISADDRQDALAALGSAIGGPGWALTPGGSRRQRAKVLRAFRILSAPGGQILCGTETACEIAFWPKIVRSDAPRADGEPHLPGTRLAPTKNDTAGYLSEPTWRRAVAARSRWALDEPLPDVLEVREPVDVVYTWVDGQDPTWLARKAAYIPGGDLNATAAQPSRYTNRDELRYSMRSVAMYANWVRTIYLVTDGQVPPWLDTTHPKIQLIDHHDVFTDPSVLPVFNSHAIESQLHHIDGLAEQYLYLNDDVFFGRPVDPELFFHSNGIAKFFLSPDTIDLDPPSRRDLPVMAAAKNLRKLMERDFGVTVHRKFRHAAHPQLRSVQTDMEKRYPDEFERVARARFRHPDDLSIASSLHHYYAYALGRAVPGRWTYRYLDISSPTAPRGLDVILRDRPQSFCLNDMASTEHQVAQQRDLLARFFGEYFPLPAPWELSDR